MLIQKTREGETEKKYDFKISLTLTRDTDKIRNNRGQKKSVIPKESRTGQGSHLRAIQS